MLPGVYRFPVTPLTWEQMVCAAQTWAGPGSAASGSCAAALWELGGIAAATVEITTPRSLRSPDPTIVLRRARLEQPEIRTRRGIPVTSPERTLLDLGRLVSRRKLESALDDALCKRLTTPGRLSGYLEARGKRGREGTAPLRALLTHLADAPGMDRFERLLSSALVTRSLPKPLPQHPVELEGRTFFLDFAYPDARLGIEAHSFKHHSKRDDWENDQVRHALLTAAGWTILYVTWRRLRDHPDLVARDVATTLERSERRNVDESALRALR